MPYSTHPEVHDPRPGEACGSLPTPFPPTALSGSRRTQTSVGPRKALFGMCRYSLAGAILRWTACFTDCVGTQPNSEARRYTCGSERPASASRECRYLTFLSRYQRYSAVASRSHVLSETRILWRSRVTNGRTRVHLDCPRPRSSNPQNPLTCTPAQTGSLVPMHYSSSSRSSRWLPGCELPRPPFSSAPLLSPTFRQSCGLARRYFPVRVQSLPTACD